MSLKLQIRSRLTLKMVRKSSYFPLPDKEPKKSKQKCQPTKSSNIMTEKMPGSTMVLQWLKSRLKTSKTSINHGQIVISWSIRVHLLLVFPLNLNDLIHSLVYSLKSQVLHSDSHKACIESGTSPIKLVMFTLKKEAHIYLKPLIKLQRTNLIFTGTLT